MDIKYNIFGVLVTELRAAAVIATTRITEVDYLIKNLAPGVSAQICADAIHMIKRLQSIIVI